MNPLQSPTDFLKDARQLLNEYDEGLIARKTGVHSSELPLASKVKAIKAAMSHVFSRVIRILFSQARNRLLARIQELRASTEELKQLLATWNDFQIGMEEHKRRVSRCREAIRSLPYEKSLPLANALNQVQSAVKDLEESFTWTEFACQLRGVRLWDDSGSLADFIRQLCSAREASLRQSAEKTSRLESLLEIRKQTLAVKDSKEFREAEMLLKGSDELESTVATLNDAERTTFTLFWPFAEDRWKRGYEQLRALSSRVSKMKESLPGRFQNQMERYREITDVPLKPGDLEVVENLFAELKSEVERATGVRSFAIPDGALTATERLFEKLIVELERVELTRLKMKVRLATADDLETLEKRLSLPADPCDIPESSDSSNDSSLHLRNLPERLRNPVERICTTEVIGSWARFVERGHLLTQGIFPEVRELEYDTGTPERQVTFEESTVPRVDLTPPSEPFSGSAVPTTELLATSVAVWLDHSSWVRSVAFSPDGRFLASAGDDEKVILRTSPARRAPGKRIPKGLLPLQGREPITLEGHTSWVLCVVFSPSGKWIASGSHDGTIMAWGVKDNKIKFKLPQAHHGWIGAIAVSPDGRTLVSGGQDKEISFWNARYFRKVHSIAIETPVNSLVFSPSGETLFAATRDKVITGWEVNAGCPLLKLTSRSIVRSISVSPNGALLAGGAADGEIYIWNIAASVAARVLSGHQEGVNFVTFSHDGNLLASAGEDQTVRVWEVESGNPLVILSEHRQAVRSVAFSPDARFIASGSFDRSVRIWKLFSGKASFDG